MKPQQIVLSLCFLFCFGVVWGVRIPATCDSPVCRAEKIVATAEEEAANPDKADLNVVVLQNQVAELKRMLKKVVDVNHAKSAKKIASEIERFKQSALAEIIVKNEAALESKKTELRKAVSVTRSASKAKLESAKVELTKKLSSAKSSAQDEVDKLSASLKLELDKFTKENEMKQKTLESEFNLKRSEAKLKFQKAEKEHEASVVAKSSSDKLAALSKVVSETSKELAARESEFSAKLKDLKKSNDESLSDLKKSHAKQIQDLKESKQSELKMLKLKFDLGYEALKKKCQLEIDEINRKLKSLLFAEQAAYEKELAAVTSSMQGEIDSETLKFEVNINKITSSLKEDSAARNAKLLSSLQSDVENTLKVLSGNLEKSLSNTRETLKKDLEFSQEKIGKAKADAEKLQASLTKAKSTADSLVKSEKGRNEAISKAAATLLKQQASLSTMTKNTDEYNSMLNYITESQKVLSFLASAASATAPESRSVSIQTDMIKAKEAVVKALQEQKTSLSSNIKIASATSSKVSAELENSLRAIAKGVVSGVLGVSTSSKVNNFVKSLPSAAKQIINSMDLNDPKVKGLISKMITDGIGSRPGKPDVLTVLNYIKKKSANAEETFKPRPPEPVVLATTSSVPSTLAPSTNNSLTVVIDINVMTKKLLSSGSHLSRKDMNGKVVEQFVAVDWDKYTKEYQDYLIKQLEQPVNSAGGITSSKIDYNPATRYDYDYIDSNGERVFGFDAPPETFKIVDNANDDESFVEFETTLDFEEESNVEVNGPLPNGWISQIDPKTGKEYFFNSRTGESSWTRPVNKSPVKPVIKPSKGKVGDKVHPVSGIALSFPLGRPGFLNGICPCKGKRLVCGAEGVCANIFAELSRTKEEVNILKEEVADLLDPRSDDSKKIKDLNSRIKFQEQVILNHESMKKKLILQVKNVNSRRSKVELDIAEIIDHETPGSEDSSKLEELLESAKHDASRAGKSLEDVKAKVNSYGIQVKAITEELATAMSDSEVIANKITKAKEEQESKKKMAETLTAEFKRLLKLQDEESDNDELKEVVFSKRASLESAEEKLRVSRDSELKYVARIVSNELRLQEMIAKLARITLLADSHDVTKSISEKIVLASKKYDLIKQERERIEKSWAELNGKNTEFSNLKKAVDTEDVKVGELKDALAEVANTISMLGADASDAVKKEFQSKKDYFSSKLKESETSLLKAKQTYEEFKKKNDNLDDSTKSKADLKAALYKETRAKFVLSSLEMGKKQLNEAAKLKAVVLSEAAEIKEILSNLLNKK